METILTTIVYIAFIVWLAYVFEYDGSTTVPTSKFGVSVSAAAYGPMCVGYAAGYLVDQPIFKKKDTIEKMERAALCEMKRIHQAVDEIEKTRATELTKLNQELGK